MFVEVGLRFVVQFGLNDRRRRRSCHGAAAIFRERFARKQNFVFLASISWSGRTLFAFWSAIFEPRLAAAIVEAAIWRTTAIVAIAVAAARIARIVAALISLGRSVFRGRKIAPAR